MLELRRYIVDTQLHNKGNVRLFVRKKKQDCLVSIKEEIYARTPPCQNGLYYYATTTTIQHTLAFFKNKDN